MRYRFPSPAVGASIESHSQALNAVSKQLQQPRWVRGHLFVVTLDDDGADAPTPPAGGGLGGQDGGAQPAVGGGSQGGLVAVQQNSAFPEGDTIHYAEAGERLLAVRFSLHRPTESSTSDGFVQVRCRDWKGETWLGQVMSSLEGELGRGDTIEVGIDLEPGAELGGVYARIGKGPAYHPSRGTLHLLVGWR